MNQSSDLPEGLSQEAQDVLPLVIGLHQRCLRCVDVAELGFVIANETWHVLPFRQACVFMVDMFGKLALQTVTGLSSTQEDTPFGLWVARVNQLLAHETMNAPVPRRLVASMLPQELANGWTEWWPEHAVAVPLCHGGQILGQVLLVREASWTDSDLSLLTMMAETWTHCARLHLRSRIDWRARAHAWWQRPRRKQVLVALAVLTLLPVRMSVLAPAEIIALHAQVLAAPMDGVVKRFHVEPNSPVKAGTVVFSLDETALRNRREVARESLAVARTDALAAEQKSFDSQQTKADLLSLRGKVREREAELAGIEEALARIDVTAPGDGVAVFGDPNDWLGKPVVTGERIALLAPPDELGVLVWLPVGDAINLEPGASIRVYLQSAPLSALSGELVQTSYQATLSPDGVATYRIRGRLEAGSDARIGLRGVAKVYGGWRPLAYWVLRRPVGALRQWLGV